MKSKRHYASILAIAAAIGLSTFAGESSAHAQLFPRLRARLEPLLQPQPLPNPLGQPPSNPAVQPQPRPQSPLRPIQPIARPNQITPTPNTSTVDNRASATSGSGSLGVDVEQMNMAMQGLRVTRISDHSRANEAGLREGDVIVAIDGQETPTIEAVVAVLGQRRAGETVVARVIRGRRLGQLTIPLVEKSLMSRPVASAKPVSPQPESREPTVASQRREPAKSVLVPNDPVPSVPDTPESPALPESPAPSESLASDSMLKRLGIEVEDAQVVRGAVIKEIEAGSAGERLGLQVADRIVSVDGEFVFTAPRFETRLQQWKADKPLKLQLIRDERLLTLSVDPGSTLENDAVANSAGGGDGDTGSMLEGVGAALGNFLAGQKKTSNEAASNEAANNDAKRGSAPSAAMENLPPAQSRSTLNPVANADGVTDADPLAFGDEETIDQAAFEDLATPKVDPVERAFDSDLLTRPPETGVTTKRGKELDAEIERLERQLEEMKAKAAEKK
ncbi:PDZ domain-containing protein [Novipirellula maiorica]|nr:PDZ domain-containing protein [Rhodopirellula maiorica]